MGIEFLIYVVVWTDYYANLTNAQNYSILYLQKERRNCNDGKYYLYL